jgi:hypothetical protein
MSLFALGIVAPAAVAATIHGRVQVSGTGDSLPGATVTLTGPAIHGSRTTTADSHGHYYFLDVPAGADYRLKAELIGLSPWPMGIEYLYSGDVQRADLPLYIGFRECSLGREWLVPASPAPPGTTRFRADELRLLP